MIRGADDVVGIVVDRRDDVLFLLLVTVRNYVLVPAAVVLVEELRVDVVELEGVQRVQIAVLGAVAVGPRVIVLVVVELSAGEVVVWLVRLLVGQLLLVVLQIFVHLGATGREGEEVAIEFGVRRQLIAGRPVALVTVPEIAIYEFPVMRFASRFSPQVGCRVG